LRVAGAGAPVWLIPRRPQFDPEARYEREV